MALVDKFHIIRKCIALVQLFFCIVVFTFSLILLIIGGVAHASASSTNSDFYQSTDYLSGASLLIAAGLFGIIIAVIGAFGAIPCLFDRQDNWNLWIGLGVLIIYILVLLGIFIFEIAAGGWAVTQWDYVSSILENQLRDEVQRNYGVQGSELFTKSVDSVQMELECCGISNVSDWKTSVWSNTSRTGYVPSSCCDPLSNQTLNTTMSSSNMTTPTPTTSMSSSNMTTPTPTTSPACPSYRGYQRGCWEQIQAILASYTTAIAGAAIALAILQLIITLVPIALLIIVIVELRRSRSLELK